MNDTESAVDCGFCLYADDSALLIRGKHIIDIEQKLSEELSKLNVWLIDNKLSLHIGKTGVYPICLKLEVNTQWAQILRSLNVTLPIGNYLNLWSLSLACNWQ